MSKLTSAAVYQALHRDLDLATEQVAVYDSSLHANVQYQAICALRDNFLKKYVPKENSYLDHIAYYTFEHANFRCEKWSLEEAKKAMKSADDVTFNDFVQLVQNFFLDDLGQDVALSWGNIALNARCGPGSAIGANGTSFYSKLASGPLTATSNDLQRLYAAEIFLYPEHANMENIRKANYGDVEIVRGSRSCFVPKSVKTSRMISVEPSLNMYYQLGLGEIIRKRLLRFFGIDLATQPSINRMLAMIGSRIDSTFGDGFATIDLSSASDSISLGLCSAVLPDEWLSAMLSLRSATAEINDITRTSFDVKLNMMSTMGNGFTFPLQTALFACMAAACIGSSDSIRQHARANNPSNLAGQFSVFGDDIVIRSKEAPRLLRLLEITGFTPNLEKTFTSGNFRESCGHDYYCGHNIRPVYLRRLDTETDVVVLVNLLCDWGVRNHVSLRHTLKLLVGSIKRPNIVPMSETMDAGIRVPYIVARTVSKLGSRRDPDVQSYAYEKRYAVSKRICISDGLVTVPKGTKRHIYNPSGLFMSFLRGEVRNGSISLQSSRPIYRTRRAVSPNWDYTVQPLESLLMGCETSPAEFTTQYAEAILPHLLKRRFDK